MVACEMYVRSTSYYSNVKKLENERLPNLRFYCSPFLD